MNLLYLYYYLVTIIINIIIIIFKLGKVYVFEKN